MRKYIKVKKTSEKALTAYQNYIEKLMLPQKIKEQISYNRREHSVYYLFYPYLFKDAFKEGCSEKIEALSIAGFLYFQSVLYTDKVLDSQVTGEKTSQYNLLSMMCLEEAIKILASVFPLNSSFWTFWNKRRSEYLSAYKNDKIDFGNNFSDIEISFFYDLADHKSAFGKVAIDCLLILSEGGMSPENVAIHEKLTQSHRHFSIGRQLYDDICDLKEDFINKQTNFALYKLQKACLQEGINFENLNDIELEKYMYVLGVADELLGLAITHFEIAIELSKTKPSDLQIWIDINNIYIEMLKEFEIKQANYLQKIRYQLGIISDD